MTKRETKEREQKTKNNECKNGQRKNMNKIKREKFFFTYSLRVEHNTSFLGVCECFPIYIHQQRTPHKRSHTSRATN